MNPWLRLVERWQSKGQRGPRRRILLEVVGLELAAVDRYLDQGLLHNLALVSDVGGRTNLAGSIAAQLALVRQEARSRGIRVVELAPPSDGDSPELAAICQNDELRQTRLIEQLRRRPGNDLIICSFDMPARLHQLYGSSPDEAEQLVLRDVYARMDEVVGKAYSFVSDSVVLAVAILPQQDCRGECDAPMSTALFFSQGHISPVELPIDLSAALFSNANLVGKRI